MSMDLCVCVCVLPGSALKRKIFLRKLLLESDSFLFHSFNKLLVVLLLLPARWKCSFFTYAVLPYMKKTRTSVWVCLSASVGYVCFDAKTKKGFTYDRRPHNRVLKKWRLVVRQQCSKNSQKTTEWDRHSETNTKNPPQNCCSAIRAI